MNLRITVRPRWFGPVPRRDTKPLPKSQWVRAGRRRRWSVRWWSPDGKRPRKTFETQEDALDFARKLNHDSEQRGPQARMRPKRISIGEFATEFSKLGIGPRGGRLALASIHEYQAVLDRFVKFVGKRTPLESITIADATRYLASLREKPSRRKKPLSTASVNKHKRGLKVVFNVAVRQLHYLTFSPFTNLMPDRIPQKTLRIVSPAEFEKLLDAARKLPNRSLWWETYLFLAYTSGARANEMTHLLWRDVDFERSTVRITAQAETEGVEAWHPKGYNSRVIPVPDRTLALLAKLQAAATEGSSFVFLSEERVTRIREAREQGTWKPGRAVMHNLTRDFAVLVRAAGIPHASLHDLRRACITHWALKLPAPVVQVLAGHSDIKTTMRHYVSIRPEDLAAAKAVTTEALTPLPAPTAA